MGILFARPSLISCMDCQGKTALSSGVSLGSPEELSQQHMKVMDAVLSLHRIPPTIVGCRLQTALHAFAQSDVFLLHLVAESDRLLDPLLHRFRGHIVKEPF